MTNLVEITVRLKDDASKALGPTIAAFTAAGGKAGQGFNNSFSRQMGQGALGSIMGGKGGGSVVGTSQATGQNVGTGLARGILQKFSSTMGSGLLSGLFGTSGSQKLFAGAGNQVVQSAQNQGGQIGQGLAKGLTQSLSSAQSRMGALLSGILGSGSGQASAQAASTGQAAGKSYANGFTAAVAGVISKFKMPAPKGGAAGGSGAGASGAAKGIAGGAMPGIMGMGGLAASAVGIGGSLLGAIPAVAALGAGLGVIAGGFGLLEKGDKTFAATIKSDFAGIGATMQKVVQPLAGPLLDAFKQLGGFVKSIAPELHSMFAAAGPLIQPLLKGIESLVSGLLPGLISILHAARPAFDAFASVLGSLGKDLGGMLGGFSPVIKASSVIFKALADVLSALFPIIGKIAGEMATALAPIFKTFAGIIKDLLPVFTVIGKVLADFAGAVLTDLVGVFSALGTLVADLAPSFKTLAGALGNVFNVLENSGVFAIIGNALEAIAPVLAQFINLLVQQLAPFLPTLIGLVSKFAGILATLLAAGLTAVLGALTFLLQKFPALVPIIAGLGVAWMALNAIMALNPFVAVATAALIMVGLIVKYHQQIYNFIVQTWDAVSKYVAGVWNNFLGFARSWWPLLLGPGGVIVKYHEDIWSFIQSIWHTITNFISSTWDTIWNNTVARVSRGVTDVINYFKALPGNILNSLGNAGNTLLGWGRGVINGLLSGMTSVIGSVWNFIKGIPGKILSFLGINSPPQWAIDAGKHIMNGLGIGMTQAQNAAKKATSAFTASTVANVGSGVTRWTADVQQALRMEGLSLSLTAQVLRQISSESGGNPNAINLTDINAQHGDPSRGLLQPIGSTFSAYHWPGTSFNIYDPLANIAAAINYARHVYGPNLMSGGNGLGSGHGYAGGGVTSAGWALVGERGREMVKLPGGAMVSTAGATAGMMAGGGANICLELTPGGSAFDEFLLKWMQKHVRVKGGGSVQKTFGTA